MSISHHISDSAPAGVLAEMVAELRDLAQMLWPARSDGELVELVEQVAAVRAVLTAVEAGAVAEADAREIAKKRLHYGSTGDWLTHVGGWHHGEGKRVVARAKALTGALTRTRVAMVAGAVSAEQADVIVRSIAELPPQQWARRRGEKVMLRHARSLDASELARAGRHLVEVVDPDGADRRLEAALDRVERAAHLDRHLAISQDQAGGVRIRGRGSAEDGALIRAALLPLTSPAPAADDETGQVVHDPREHGARLWDALVATAQHALDTHLPPETHGSPARLLVTLDHESLLHALQARGVPTATADGIDLPPAVVRRLACDAEIVPAVYGGRGELLDVGRLHRLVTPAIWTALVARDRHCTFPACTRPPVMCQAHHLTHWADGGPTSLDNLALLCGHHHRVTHHTPWRLRLDPDDRRPQFKPPPLRGIERGWIRDRPRRQ